MIQSFFLITNSGEVLIEKHWRDITGRDVCDFFWDEVNKYDSKEEIPPVLSTTKYYLINIFRDNIFFMCTTTCETSPLRIIEFLHRVFDTFEDYFGTLEENTIKDNFSLIYQLLEEMMDFGYPLTMEPNALKAMIKPPSIINKLATVVGQGTSQVSDVLPDGTISNMPWRQAGVIHNQNEIYLDIVEEVDSTLSVNGTIVSSEVSGVILGNSKLSGVPDLALQFLDPSLIDDCSFHPCVRYNRFERDRVVSFVPPDGTFELMKYRVNTSSGHTVAPCYVQPAVSYDYEGRKGSIALIVGTRSSSSLLFPNSSGTAPALSIEDVVIEIPFPKHVRTANLEVDEGTVLYDESTKIAKWSIGKLADGKHPKLTGSMLLQHLKSDLEITPTSKKGSGKHERRDSSGRDSVENMSSVGGEIVDSPPIQMHWKVPMASLSGMSVASLQLMNESYKPYKGVRTIAKSGKFQVRTI